MMTNDTQEHFKDAATIQARARQLMSEGWTCLVKVRSLDADGRPCDWRAPGAKDQWDGYSCFRRTLEGGEEEGISLNFEETADRRGNPKAIYVPEDEGAV